MLKNITLTSLALFITLTLSPSTKAETIDPNTLTCTDLITLLEADNPSNAGTTLLIALGHYLSTTENSSIDLNTVPTLIGDTAALCALPSNAEMPLPAAFANAENTEEP